MEQMTLFDNEIRNISVPLASRVRPKNLDQFVGQQHLIGQGKILRRMIETDVYKRQQLRTATVLWFWSRAELLSVEHTIN